MSVTEKKVIIAQENNLYFSLKETHLKQKHYKSRLADAKRKEKQMFFRGNNKWLVFHFQLKYMNIYL